MYRLLVNLFQIIRWLSLDIALGGAILLLYVSRELYGLQVPFVLIVLLVIAILIIYTIDHLMDAQRVENPTMPRHVFHKSYQKPLFYYLICLVVLGFICVFFVELPVLFAGTVVAVVCGIYLVINRGLANKGSKELTVAFVYATAMFIYPATKELLTLFDLLYWLQLFFLAVINLMIISYYEHQRDALDKTTSLAHVLGVNRTRKAAFILLTISMTISFTLFTLNLNSNYPLFAGLANLVLLVVILFDSIFYAKERYRFACDAVFLIPVFLL